MPELWRVLFGKVNGVEVSQPYVIGRLRQGPVKYPEHTELRLTPTKTEWLFQELLRGDTFGFPDEAVSVIGRIPEGYILKAGDDDITIFCADAGLVEGLGFDPSHFNWGQK